MMIRISSPLIVLCMIIHIQFMIYNSWLVNTTMHSERNLLNLAKALAVLAYPFCGWAAEVLTTRARMIKWSFTVSLLGAVLTEIVFILFTFSFDKRGIVIGVCYALAIITNLVSISMFEANAIQFGMIQMIEASSEELSCFIHWYFWCVHVGQITAYYLVLGALSFCINCHIQFPSTSAESIKYNTYFMLGEMMSIVVAFHLLVAFIGIIFANCSKIFQCQLPTQNSFKMIFQVLQYAYHHKQPVRRSAMTYWEDYIPSRIDLGKDKYGGPFTYEQVEDVKTFFRLLLLILSLFGFHLLGDGYSLTKYIISIFGCPRQIPFNTVIANPRHTTLVTVMIGVPLIRCLRVYFKQFSFNMLRKIWFGLVLSLVAQTTVVLYSLILNGSTQENYCPEEHLLMQHHTPVLRTCLLMNAEININNTCHRFCTGIPIEKDVYKIYLALIPQALQGVAYVLVFMTTLEFICAQAPNSMKGLLIGLWYSTSSINCAIDMFDDASMFDNKNIWSVYNGIKGVGIFLSIILFSLLYKRYRYREKDEVVNEQAIIEEQYERELLLHGTSHDPHSLFKPDNI